MLLRVLLIVLGVLVLLPVLAVAGFVLFFDPGSYAPRIAAYAAQATGRNVRLGDIQLAWSLTPRLTVSNVGVAGPAPGAPDTLSVAQAELRVALWPLLSGRVEIASLRLIEPRLVLPFPAPKPAEPAQPPAAQAPPAGTRRGAPFDLREVRVERAALQLVDAQAGRTMDVQLPDFQLDATDAGTTLRGRGELRGWPLPAGSPALLLALDATMGPLGRLFRPNDPGDAPWPLHATLSGNGAQLVVDGTVADPQRGTGVALQVSATAADLAGLAPGVPARDVRASARIGDAGALSELSVQAGAADLSALLPGLRLQRLSVAAPAPDQPLRVELEGTLGDAPIRGTASVLPRPDRQGAAVRGLRLQTPLGDVAGDLAVLVAPRPALRGSLVSQRVDVDALRALIAARPVPATPAGPASPPPPDDGRRIPDRPLPFDALRRADADLTWSVAQLRLGGADWQGIQTRLALTEGRLRLDPLTAAAPGGRLDGTVAADATATPPTLAITLNAPQLALGPAMAAFGQPDGAASGTAGLELSVSGAGATTRALLAALDGVVGLTVVDAEVANAPAVALFSEVLRGLNLPLGDAGGRSRLRCLALRLEARHGAVQVQTLLLDSSRLHLVGEGGFSLADETLALRLRPSLRLGGTNIASPLRVDGTFGRPRPQMDALAPGRTGVVIGGAAAPADECGPALLAARAGRPGPMPSAEAAPPRSGNPADLLRGLLGRPRP